MTTDELIVNEIESSGDFDRFRKQIFSTFDEKYNTLLREKIQSTMTLLKDEITTLLKTDSNQVQSLQSKILDCISEFNGDEQVMDVLGMESVEMKIKECVANMVRLKTGQSVLEHEEKIENVQVENVTQTTVTETTVAETTVTETIVTEKVEILETGLVTETNTEKVEMVENVTMTEKVDTELVSEFVDFEAPSVKKDTPPETPMEAKAEESTSNVQEPTIAEEKVDDKMEPSPVAIEKRKREDDQVETTEKDTKNEESKPVESHEPVMKKTKNMNEYPIGYQVASFVETQEEGEETKTKKCLLLTVTEYDPSTGEYTLSDADDESTQTFKIPYDMIIDYQKTQSSQVSGGDKVYALFEIEDGFSTQFYEAIVLKKYKQSVWVVYTDGEKGKVTIDQLFKIESDQ